MCLYLNFCLEDGMGVWREFGADVEGAGDGPDEGGTHDEHPGQHHQQLHEGKNNRWENKTMYILYRATSERTKLYKYVHTLLFIFYGMIN